MKYIKNITIWAVCLTTLLTPVRVSFNRLLNENNISTLNYSSLFRESLLSSNFLNLYKSKKLLDNKLLLSNTFINAQKSNLLKTPKLGLAFWQNDKEILLQQIDKKTTKVVLNNEPFYIVIPSEYPKDIGIRIRAWIDDSIFSDDLKLENNASLLERGWAYMIIKSTYGSATLWLSNKVFNQNNQNNQINNASHNYYFERHFTYLNNDLRSIYIAKIQNTLSDDIGEKQKITLYQFKGKLFLVIYVDKNQDKMIDENEYEFIVLEIN